MSDPTESYMGEIRYLGFPFNPMGWAYCNGALLAIQQATTLFSLLGTNFGGNGTTNFQLPNLSARQACGKGPGPALTPRSVGETFGAPAVFLIQSELPPHTHQVTDYVGVANQTAGPATNGSSALGTSELTSMFGGQAPPNAMFAIQAISVAGNGMAHENRQPILAVNACISLQGDYPSFS